MRQRATLSILKLLFHTSSPSGVLLGKKSSSGKNGFGYNEKNM